MDFLNAYTYGFCEKRGFTEGKGWKRSMEEMVCSTGCNAIILPVCGFQDHIWSTQIDSDTTDVISEGDCKKKFTAEKEEKQRTGAPRKIKRMCKASLLRKQSRDR